MTPVVRKLVLTCHVTVSVGWLGAVAGFLALAVAGLTGDDPLRVRAAYLAMELVGWWVIVPASIGSLVTGLVHALGGEWGLVRHYWVLIKLVLTALATVVLLVHMQPVGRVAALAMAKALSAGELRDLRVQLIADAVAAQVVLVVATTLSVFKPRGVTRLGRR
jgi:hypothetical protein